MLNCEVYLLESEYQVKEVVFAIPNGKDGTRWHFKERLDLMTFREMYAIVEVKNE